MTATVEMELPQAMVYPFIKDLSISHGRAAELLGISKRKLIDIYGDMGIPYIDMDISEVEEEIAAFEEFEASAK